MTQTLQDDSRGFHIEIDESTPEPEPESKTNWLLILGGLGVAYLLLKG